MIVMGIVIIRVIMMAIIYNGSEGIRTLAGRAQWISRPSPQPPGHTVKWWPSDGTSYKESAVTSLVHRQSSLGTNI